MAKKQRMIVLFLRAIFKQYIEKNHMNYTKGKHYFIDHFPIVLDVNAIAKWEYDYIFRPYTAEEEGAD